MKNRISSMLLSILAVVVIFTVMSSQASAEGETIQYTIKSGDTIFSVCIKLGIDFDNNYDWIAKENNITDPSKLYVGTVLTLPSPNYTPEKTEEEPSETVKSDSDSGTIETIKYTLKNGDSVLSVCKKLGIDFYANYNWITTTNRISNYSKLPVGKLITLPAPGVIAKVGDKSDSSDLTNPTIPNDSSSAAAGTIQYTLKRGDTVLSVCKKLGIDFNANYNWITTTNRITNYANLPVGKVILLPAPSSGTSSGTNSGTSSGTNSGTSSGTNSGTSSRTSSGTSSNTGDAGLANKDSPGDAAKAADSSAQQPQASQPIVESTDTIQYTLKSGDTVLAVCNRLGIDFKANYDWITKTNNITDYSKLYVGQVITLPAPPISDSGGNASSNNSDTNSSNSSNSNNSSGNGSNQQGGGANVPVNTDDSYVSAYLITYVVKSGDTLLKICEKYGVDYSANISKLKSINNISNLDNISVGSTLYLPLSKAPTSGTYIKVIAHKAVEGNTLVAICNAYGVDYYANVILLSRLNDRDLKQVTDNNIIYIPVSVTVTESAPAEVPAETPDPSGSVSSFITSAATVNGSVKWYAYQGIENSASALSGTSISITALANDGYMVDSISVTSASDSSVSVAVDSSNRFVMPKFDVRISVTFKPIENTSTGEGNAIIIEAA